MNELLGALFVSPLTAIVFWILVESAMLLGIVACWVATIRLIRSLSEEA